MTRDAFAQIEVRTSAAKGRRTHTIRMQTFIASLTSLVSCGVIVGCGGAASGAVDGSEAPNQLLSGTEVAQNQPLIAKQPTKIAEPISQGPYWAQGASQVVADFDSTATNSVANWTFYNGAEFPGATGSLSESNGIAAKGAKLAYNFSCGGIYWTAIASRDCGKYVSMNLAKLPTTMDFAGSTAPSISLDVRNLQATTSPTVRVVDSTGQTLQFKQLPLRPIENVSGSNWQRILVSLTKSDSFWGGANDGIVHLPIKQVAVLASNLGLATPPGELEVDNVSFVKSADTTFDLKVNPPLSAESFPSTYVGRMGVVWRPKFGYAALDKAVAVGLNVVRMDLNWEAVEINGKWNFNYYTGLATELAKRNVKILWILDYGHKDHGGATPLTAQDQAAYAEFARRTALAFKGTNLVGYEIWNEPNWQPFWPNPDPIAYSTLLGLTTDAIRSVDSSVKISTGGVADTDFDYVTTLLRTGRAAGVSAIGLHPYRKSDPETFAAQIAPFKQMAQSLGLNAEIWDTEWGYSAFSDIGSVSSYGDGHDPRALRRQAILTLRKVLTQIGANTPISILYELINEGNDPLEREHNFGLLNADLSDKPAIVGLRALFNAQNGRTLKGYLPDVPPGVHAIRWDGETTKAFVIWTDAPNGAKVQISLPNSVTSVKSWDGTTLPNVNGGKFEIRETDGPVFVTIQNQ